MSFGELAMKCKVLVSSIILLYMAGFATADILNVPSGSYPTIQSAIDAAVDGDEVVVADDIYTGVGNRDLDFSNNLPLGLTRAITVRSANGPASCIIDCQGLGRAFNFGNNEDDSSVVEGFTIKNGSADYGGGIECYWASPKISNCIITGNSADDGGGIDCYFSSPVIVDCVIADNTAGNDGAGIECWESTPAITNCLIQGNAATRYGGAIDCYNSSPTIANCTIADNSGLSDSGGIYAPYTGSSPTIIDCIIWGNGDDLDLAGGSVTYSCIEDGHSGTGNISDDPLFRTGPLGDYYLSQIAAVQLADSNCVDAGSDLASVFGLDTYTTRTDSISDADAVDMGYHYPDSSPYVNYQLTASVVVNVSGATGTISPDTGSYRQFAEIALAATPDDIGYKVKEWIGADNVPAAGEPNNIVTMSGNKLVTVEFEPRIVYQLTTAVIGGLGGTITPSTGPQYEGNVIELTATPEVGYRVYQWIGTDDDNSVDTTNYVTMDSDKTVYVEFISDFVHLDVAVIGTGGAINPARGGNYPIGEVVDLEAIPDLHYKVKEWGGDANGVPFLDPSNPNYNNVKMSEDKSVTVEFEPLAIYELTVSVVNGNGGTVSPTVPTPVDYNAVDDVYSYYEGTAVTLTAVPDVGWHVKAWYGTEDDDSTGTTNTVVMDSNSKAVFVEFELGFPSGTVWVCNPATGVPYPYNSKHPVTEVRIKNPYYKIQDAINKAFGGREGYEGDAEASPFPLLERLAVPGDLIIVADGVYTGSGNYNLDLIDPLSYIGLTNVEGKHITIRSEHGPENCIIDCGNQGGAFYLHGTEDVNTVIEGFTIKNGLASAGGGLNIEGIAAPMVRNCIIRDCNAFSGGGVYMVGLDPEDTTYADILAELEALADMLEEFAEELIQIAAEADPPDQALWDAALAAIEEAVEARINAIVFGEVVGDIGTEEASVPTVDKCKIINNKTFLVPTANGGGIFCQNVSPLIISSEIIGNSGFNGGGIYSYAAEGSTSTPAIINCLITGNESVDIGGAVYLFSSNAVINMCTVVYNTGLPYVLIPQPIPIGGIACRDASPVITNCIIGRNGSTDPDVGQWGDGATGGDDLYECDATYSCIENSEDGDGEGNIDQDPMFTRGGLGDFYLRQEQAGQGIDSSCVNAGEQYIMSDLQTPPPGGYNLDMAITTSIQNHYDIGFTDMGYHYQFYDGPPVRYDLELSVMGPGVVRYYYFPGDIPINGVTDIWDIISASIYVGTVPSGSNVVSDFEPGTLVFFVAEADDPTSYRGTWYGTDEDTSTNVWNYAFMYYDRDVHVDFDPILQRELRVPEDYELLQDAIDAARYKDQIVVERAGSENPYRTAQGFLVSNKAITIRSEDPNNPACVADTVIELQIGPEGYIDITCFRFNSVDRDTILNGITIRNFNTRGYNGIDGDPPRFWDGAPGESIYSAAIQCGGSMWYPGQRGVSGIWGSNASPTIKNCIIRDCSAIAGSGGDGAGPSDTHMPDGGHGGWPGRAYGTGICMISDSSPLVINCTFENLTAIGGDGGDGAQGNTDPEDYGKGGRGGGWYYSSPPSTPYEFAGDGSNAYLHDRDDFDYYSEYTARGGAVYVDTGCHPEFRNCSFINCRTEGGLCGICGQDGWPPEDRERPSYHWKIDNFGGAVFCYEGSSAVFENCTFNNSFADTNRPVFDPTGSPDDPYNCDNDDLVVGYGGAIAYKGDANVVLENCTFNLNRADEGGAIYGVEAGLSVTDCNFYTNVAGSGGAALFAASEGTRLTGCNFMSNQSLGASERGGAICSLGSNLVIADSKMMDNTAAGDGAGIYISSKDIDGNDIIIDGEVVPGWNKVQLLNCLIAGNISNGNGGGVSANWNAETDIINCTIADNVVSGSGPGTGFGGGLYSSFAANVSVHDSIIWGNSANFGSQIAIVASPDLPAFVNVSSSDVQGAQSNAYVSGNGTLNWDPNNLYTDPLFKVGPLGSYYLSQIVVADQNENSPCVDAGSDLASRVGMSTYTTRTDHIFDRAIVDMGYHYSVPSLAASCGICDFLYDYIINFRDFSVLSLHWLAEGCSEGNNWCQGTDLSFDSRVNNDDLFILAECWLIGDDLPPEPNPSQWRVKPYSTEDMPTEISMTAETAVDDWSGGVEYYFECAYGACNDSDWQSDANYTDTGLVTGVEYGYRVKARDEIGNETLWSPIRYAITGEGGEPDPTDNTPPTPNPMTWAAVDGVPYAISASAIQMLATTATDDSGSVEYFFDETSGNPGGTNSTWQTSPEYIDTGLVTGLTYTYRVKARDMSINRNETGWSSEESAIPEEDIEPPPELVAPSIISASQYDGGFYWYNVIVADTLVGESALYYRFVCLDDSDLNSGWVPSIGAGTVPSGLGVISYEGAGVTYTVPVGPAHMTWEWIVCGSNSDTGDVIKCSSPSLVPLN
jgi:hypothetical protein